LQDAGATGLVDRRCADTLCLTRQVAKATPTLSKHLQSHQSGECFSDICGEPTARTPGCTHRAVHVAADDQGHQCTQHDDEYNNQREIKIDRGKQAQTDNEHDPGHAQTRQAERYPVANRGQITDETQKQSATPALAQYVRWQAGNMVKHCFAQFESAILTQSLGIDDFAPT